MRQITYWLVILTVVVMVGMYVRLDQGGSTLGKLVAVPALISWFFYKLETRRFRTWGPIIISLLVFVLYSCLSLFWSVDVEATGFAIQRFASNIALALLIWDMGITEKEAQGLMQAYIISCYVAFVLMLRNASTGAELDDRATSAGVDSNILGGLVVYSVPIAWYLGTVKEKMHWFWKTVNLCLPIVAVLVIILGASRGALLLAVPGFLYVLFTLRRAPSWVMPVVLAGLAIVIPLGIYGPLQSKFQRLGTAFESIVRDGGNGRFDTWNNAVKTFYRAPITGTGVNTAATMSLKFAGDHVAGAGRNTHSLYFQVLGDLGLIGIILLGTMIYCFYRLIKQLPRQMRAAAYVALLIFVLINAQIPTLLVMPNYIFLAAFACWITANVQRAPKRVPVAQTAFVPG